MKLFLSRWPHRTRSRARRRLVPAVMLAGGLAVLAAQPVRAAASAAPGFTVGLTPFQDVSGNSDLGQLATVLPSLLQSVLLEKTSLIGRQLTADTSGGALTVAGASALGKSAGTDLVATGTLLSGSVKTSQGTFSAPGFGGFHLSANSNKMDVVVVLQVTLVDVGRGVSLGTFRATGRDSKTHIDPSVDSNYGSMDMQGAGFQNTVLGQATLRALASLAGQMQQAVRTFRPAQAAPAAAVAQPAAAGGSGPADAGSGEASAPAAQAAATGAQPDLKAVTIDFVPGEKTIFYDDFTDMAPDEPPPHWKLRGDSATLLIGKQTRELSLHRTQLTSPRIAVPANFTFQTIETFPTTGGGYPRLNWYFDPATGEPGLSLLVTGHGGNNPGLHVTAEDNRRNDLVDIDVPTVDVSRPVHLDLWVQNGRVRIYLDGNRIMDVNQIRIAPVVRLELHAHPGAGNTAVGLRQVRLAESAPEFAAAIQATGRYVTHGIHFDTNSAILKPDSAPVIRQVADALIGDPSLKLEIDGYTDSVGSAARNLELSRQRADAVRSVLVSQFGVDPGRLTAAGFGAAHPIGSNDTATGRAENRRVEFVKKS